jgi:drug/metabolite transporter (DMT)-like permease
MYYFSIVTVILSYLSTKAYKEDILELEQSTYKGVVGRFIMGYFSDILLFVAFTYTNYSKGICIFFTNTLMIPFFASCILKEKVKKVDIVAILLSFIGMILII